MSALMLFANKVYMEGKMYKNAKNILKKISNKGRLTPSKNSDMVSKIPIPSMPGIISIPCRTMI